FDRRSLVSLVHSTGETMSPPADVLQGTLDLVVLKALSLEPMHGWGISQRIQQLSKDVLQVGQGSLYPALYRLEKKGLVKSEWRTTENNREAKYYRLSAAGQRALSAEVHEWRNFARAIDLILVAE